MNYYVPSKLVGFGIDGNEIESNTVITEFDTYLGPSNPGRKEPTCLSIEEDCVTVLQSNDKNKLVTAMSIMEEENGDDGETRLVLYRGHNDGSLIKWSIDDSKQIWSKQIYKNNLDQCDSSFKHIGLLVRGTTGAAGLAVRPDLSQKGHRLVYTSTNNVEYT
jgi:hypothetical protein